MKLPQTLLLAAGLGLASCASLTGETREATMLTVHVVESTGAG